MEKRESIVVRKLLNVGRYRQRIKLMKLSKYLRSRSFLDLGQR